MKKLAISSRIILGLSALSIIAAFYLPIWKIELKAPQYPEGLSMQIWLNNITGQVDIINGLNHYIGMKKISVESFPEFAYMPTIVGILIAVGVGAALIGRRVGLVVYLSLLVLGAAAGLYDFYQWSYDYGHNLDPSAPIQIPGFSYQPPLIGYKNLLNFEAFSFPDTGGLVFFAAGLIAVGILLFEIFVSKKSNNIKGTSTQSFASTTGIIMCVLITACTSGPQPIKYGKDDCQHCRMTIMDNKFGCELINRNGKAYKFDDLGCLVQFVEEGSIKSQEVAKIYVVDFSATQQLIPVEDAQFLQGEGIKAPMASQLAAFSKNEDIASFKDQLKAKNVSWNQIQDQYKKQ